jgi:hypothetical protein
VPSLVVLLVVVLVVYALVDCLQSPGGEVHGLPKPLWLAIIVLLPLVGPLAWLVAGRQRGRASPVARTGRSVAPDDDPEFLWRLDQQRRRDDED